MDATTNFMQSKTESEGTNYAEVLKEARDLGHAEGKLLSQAGFGVNTRHELTLQGCTPFRSRRIYFDLCQHLSRLTLHTKVFSENSSLYASLEAIFQATACANSHTINKARAH